MYVRINQGTFDLAKADDVIEMLRASEEQLAPALKQLAGLQSYQTPHHHRARRV